MQRWYSIRTFADAQLEAHRAALTGHCYRMLGSPIDADDAVHETMVRAWRSRDRFDGRSSLGTWLYRIATNVCLDALSDRSRRARPFDEGPVGTVEDVLEERPRGHWLEPVPDARLLPTGANPFALVVIELSGDRVSRMTSFLDTEALFPIFGLPPELPA